MEEKHDKTKQMFRKLDKNKVIHREIVGMFKNLCGIDSDFHLNMSKMKGFIGKTLILVPALMFSGCMVVLGDIVTEKKCDCKKKCSKSEKCEKVEQPIIDKIFPKYENWYD